MEKILILNFNNIRLTSTITYYGNMSNNLDMYYNMTIILTYYGNISNNLNMHYTMTTNT